MLGRRGWWPQGSWRFRKSRGGSVRERILTRDADHTTTSDNGNPQLHLCRVGVFGARWQKRQNPALETLSWLPMETTETHYESVALPDGPPLPQVRKCMQSNKRRDTSPELKVRAMLRHLGYPGYRLDWKKAPGHPDIAYPGRKVAIFVQGCFWHRCPVCNYGLPKSNVEYWVAKFERNVERDKRTKQQLEEMGWDCIEIWEHQLGKKHLEETERYLAEELKKTGKF